MKISFLTLGCRTNQAESSYLSRIAAEKGHDIVPLSDNTDICVINTCSVTAKADYQSRQAISRALNKNCKIVVTGCYAELNGNLIVGKSNSLRIVENNFKYHIFNDLPIATSSSLCNSRYHSRHRPSIKVQDGCNNSCTYCIIPTARGRSRSVAPHVVIDQIIELENSGFEEVVLCGIHLGSYGHDLNIEYTLAKLLEEILTSTHKIRIRLSSIEINELTDHFLNVFHDLRICRHLHIPLQSGNDSILALMNRPYTTTSFGNKINTISSLFKNISLGTDVILGFPSESSLHFNSIKAYISDLPFTYLHVFPYSDRRGTRASTFKGKVQDNTKKNRCKEISELGRMKKDFFIKNNIGLEHDILIENLTPKGYLGTTSNYIKALIGADLSAKPGSLIKIRLTADHVQPALSFPINISQASCK